jgi:Asp-tRNA(Asn)/Glu-tRNA(Gln) amidotransferase A subunit family amidase
MLWYAVIHALLIVPTGAHGCFSSVTVSGPLATNLPDLTLLYAAMCNTDYPKNFSSSVATSSSPETAGALDAADVAATAAAAGVAAAAAVSAPVLQPLELPQQLAGSTSGQSKPLAGLRVGIPRQVC